jgi:hypothetical protein
MPTGTWTQDRRRGLWSLLSYRANPLYPPLKNAATEPRRKDLIGLANTMQDTAGEDGLHCLLRR